MVVEVVISSGRPTGTAATIADEAVRLFGERLHLAPNDILFVFHEVEPNLPRFPAASIRREATGCLSRRSATSSWRQRKSIGRGTSKKRAGRDACLEDNAEMATGRFSYPRSCHTTSRCMRGCDLCVPKTLSVLMTPRNHLSWRNDRAPVFRRDGVGLTIQVEDPA